MRDLISEELDNVSGGGPNGPIGPDQEPDSRSLTTPWTFLQDVMGLSEIQVSTAMLNDPGTSNAAAALLLCDSGVIESYSQGNTSSESDEVAVNTEAGASNFLTGIYGIATAENSEESTSGDAFSVTCNTD